MAQTTYSTNQGPNTMSKSNTDTVIQFNSKDEISNYIKSLLNVKNSIIHSKNSHLFSINHNVFHLVHKDHIYQFFNQYCNKKNTVSQIYFNEMQELKSCFYFIMYIGESKNRKTIKEHEEEIMKFVDTFFKDHGIHSPSQLYLYPYPSNKNKYIVLCPSVLFSSMTELRKCMEELSNCILRRQFYRDDFDYFFTFLESPKKVYKNFQQIDIFPEMLKDGVFPFVYPNINYSYYIYRSKNSDCIDFKYTFELLKQNIVSKDNTMENLENDNKQCNTITKPQDKKLVEPQELMYQDVINAFNTLQSMKLQVEDENKILEIRIDEYKKQIEDLSGHQDLKCKEMETIKLERDMYKEKYETMVREKQEFLKNIANQLQNDLKK